MFGKILIALILLVIAAGVLFAVGPRVAVDTTITFDGAQIGDDIEAYLAQRESRFDDIRDGLEKEIVWAYPASKARTPLSVVYMHGFSSSKGETRPLADIVARKTGANLFYTRLTGHGRDGEAMAEATVNAWVNDMAEAAEVGRRIGEKVIVIGTSTGGGIAAWAATEPPLLDRVAALVFISPNFGIRESGAGLLTLPWGETLARLIAGDERSYEPQNELHAHHNTTRYPIAAVLPLAAMTTLASAAPYDGVAIPALFILSDADKVVRPGATREIARMWGGDWEIVAVDNADDPSQHVIAGDTLSPSTTDELAAKIVDWIGKAVE